MSIDDQPAPIDDNLRLAIIRAIRIAQLQIRWKPSKDVQHLVKRIDFGHLAAGTTISQYESIIAAVLHENRAKVYIFYYGDIPYPTVVATVQNRVWLVMIGLDGTMETAFPPYDPDTYLSDPQYVFVTVLEELLK